MVAPIYRLAVFAPRSIDPSEVTPLRPSGNMIDNDQYEIDSAGMLGILGAHVTRGRAVVIGATTSRYLIRNPVGAWPTTQISLEIWAKVNNSSATAQTLFSYARQTTEFNEVLLQLVPSTGQLQLFIGGTGATASTAGSVPNDGAYHHIVVTWTSAGGGVAYYVDGAAQGTPTVQNAYTIVGGGIIVIGQDQDSAGGGFDATQAWDGEIDDVRVYARVLSSTEVANSFQWGWYNTGGLSADYDNRDRLLAHWSFNDNANLGYDESGTGNDLTVVGITEGTELHAFGGNWALRVTTANQTNSGLRIERRGGPTAPPEALDAILVTAGTIYSFYAWLYAPPAAVGKTIKMAIGWNLDDVPTGTDQIIYTLTLGWQKLAVEHMIAPPTTNEAELYLVTDKPEGVFDFWVDTPWFASDLVTLHSDVFQIATNDSDLAWKPYLKGLDNGRRGNVDVRNKGSDTGVMTFDLVDPQLPGDDPLERWFEAFLGDQRGQLRGGGFMARSYESLDGGATFTPFFAGRLRVIEQPNGVRFSLQIRELIDDLAELAFVSLPHPDAYYASFSSLLPVAGLSVPAAEKPIASVSVANPTTITTKKPHGYATGDVVLIGGSDATPSSINASFTITVTGATTFTVPVNVTVAGTKGHVSKYVTGLTIPFGTLPVVKPLTGSIQPAVYAKGRIVHLDGEAGKSGSRARLDNIITSNLMGAAHFAPGEVMFSQTRPGKAKVRIRKTSNGAVGYFTCWLSFTDPTIVAGQLPSNVSGTFPGAGNLNSGKHWRILEIGITELDPSEPGYMSFSDLPTNTAVEAIVVPDATVSDAMPLFIGDVHPVTLWRHLLEGKFGFRWAVGESLPPGASYGDPRVPIAYDAAAFAALEADTTFTPVRFQVTRRSPRGAWIQENILPAANLAFCLDGQGRIVPIDLRTPTDLSGVPTVTNADLAQAAPRRWKYDRGQAITRIDATYYGDVQQTTVQDINADSAIYPTIAGSGLVELEYPITILSGNVDVGDAPFALKLPGFRAMVGEGLNGLDRRAYLEGAIQALAHETARPFGQGAPGLDLSFRRGSAGDVRQGKLLKIAITTVPDPATNRRGGTRVVRVTQRAERKSWVDLGVMDLGLTVTADVPTLGVPSLDPANYLSGISVAVTLNAAGDPVEVQYAATATGVGSAPGATSPLWRSIPSGLVRTSSIVLFGGLPANSRIWVRGRSFPDHRVGYKLPSAFVAASSPGRVDLVFLPALANLVGSLQGSRFFRVSWDLATNWLLHSEELSDAYWAVAQATISADATAAPDGLITADKLVETAVNNVHTLTSSAVTIASGEFVLVSCLAKAAERSKVYLTGVSGGDSFRAKFDLTGAGTVISTTTTGAGTYTASAIIALGNGWYWLVLIGKVNGAHTTAFLQASTLDASGNESYLGVAANGLYLWGMQMERGNSTAPSPYMRTTTLPVSAGLPIEILIATPTTDPRVVLVRLPAGSRYFDFPGDTGLVLVPSTTYRVGLRHYIASPASVGGEVTVDVATNSTDPVIDLPHPPRLFN